MRAIDTNVIVRFLTADDPRQAKAARREIGGGDIFIGATVLLEAEWVLRAGYGFAAGQIADSFARLGGLPEIALERPAEVAQALAWMREGMDFADGLHLAKAGHCSTFISFDRKLANRARRLGAMNVEHP